MSTRWAIFRQASLILLLTVSEALRPDMAANVSESEGGNSKCQKNDWLAFVCLRWFGLF